MVEQGQSTKSEPLRWTALIPGLPRSLARLRHGSPVGEGVPTVTAKAWAVGDSQVMPYALHTVPKAVALT